MIYDRIPAHLIERALTYQLLPVGEVVYISSFYCQLDSRKTVWIDPDVHFCRTSAEADEAYAAYAVLKVAKQSDGSLVLLEADPRDWVLRAYSGSARYVDHVRDAGDLYPIDVSAMPPTILDVVSLGEFLAYEDMPTAYVTLYDFQIASTGAVYLPADAWLHQEPLDELAPDNVNALLTKLGDGRIRVTLPDGIVAKLAYDDPDQHDRFASHTGLVRIHEVEIIEETTPHA